MRSFPRSRALLAVAAVIVTAAACTSSTAHRPPSPTVGTGTGSATAPSVAVSTPSGSHLATPAPTQTVSTPEQLAAALAGARAGTVITLADGQYLNHKGDRWQLTASGTADNPITLEGGRGAILESDSTSGDYGLWITGSYWHVTGISVRNATKGIVLDGTQHSIIDNVEVYDIGEEGVHFRTCSSDGVLQNSSIHDTGLNKPQFGEGVYVGSAQSNWGKYGCAAGQDKSERTVIRSNTFTHIAAEGADLKEGTDSGLVMGNLFSDTGYSGKNSTDSAVDVKGPGVDRRDQHRQRPPRGGPGRFPDPRSLPGVRHGQHLHGQRRRRHVAGLRIWPLPAGGEHRAVRQPGARRGRWSRRVAEHGDGVHPVTSAATRRRVRRTFQVPTAGGSDQPPAADGSQGAIRRRTTGDGATPS